MRACIYVAFASALLASCTSSQPETRTADQGIAEIRVDGRSLLAANITHVTVESAGESQDLLLNPFTGTFDGTLFLPSGTQSLVARAFSSETLVGLSSPTPVVVTAGVVTRVVMRLIDLTTEPPPIYGPIFDSLTFPTTTQAEFEATFAISVVAPVGDPVSYAWSSDCADATFTTPQAATTGWSKAAEGTCTISVVASSNGFSVAQSFAIVVFPAGSGTGALDVSGVLVTAPSIFVAFPELSCFVSPGTNASCPRTAASPGAPQYQVSITTWGSSAPGTLEVSDSCGGRFGVSSQAVGFVSGNWLPPVDGGICIVTARAVNGDGLVGTATVAILAEPGAPATARPPQIFVEFGTGCFLNTPPAECGPVTAGGQVFLFGSVFWDDGFPGATTIIDDCGGSLAQPTSAFFPSNLWTVPSTPGTACTTTMRATNLEGITTEVAAHYHLQ